MLSLDDDRWQSLQGGYRMTFDPRTLLAKLAANMDTKVAWHELWEGLHHQGDVGEASYAAVPYLVRIYRERGAGDWNIYAIVAVIELARNGGHNPDVPSWLEKDYFHAIWELAELGTSELLDASDSDTSRAILSILAIAKSARTHARLLLNYSEEELLEIMRGLE
jgi:hypothetical protein